MCGYAIIKHEQCGEIAMLIRKCALKNGGPLSPDDVLWPEGTMAHPGEKVICRFCGKPVQIFITEEYESAYASSSMQVLH